MIGGNYFGQPYFGQGYAVEISAVNLVVSDLAIALTYDSVTLTQKHSISVADITLSLTFDSPVVVRNWTIVVQDVALSLSFEAPLLMQKHALAATDITLSLPFETPTLTQKHTLNVNDALISLSEDAPIIFQRILLTGVGDLSLTTSLDSGFILAQKHLLSPADISVHLAYDNALLDVMLYVADLALSLQFEGAEARVTLVWREIAPVADDWTRNLTLDSLQKHATSYNDASLTYNDANTYYNGYNPSSLTEDGSKPNDWGKLDPISAAWQQITQNADDWSQNPTLKTLLDAATPYNSITTSYNAADVYYNGYNPAGQSADASKSTDWSKT